MGGSLLIWSVLTVGTVLGTEWDPEENLGDLMKSNPSRAVVHFFNALNPETMDLVDVFYDSGATFIDPIGRHTGIVEIRKYYEGIYGPVTEISFNFGEPIEQGERLAMSWTMKFRSSKLKGGKELSVDGLSVFRFDPKLGKVTYHRDYFDVAEMVYEHVPVVGATIRYIKKRLKGK